MAREMGPKTFLILIGVLLLSGAGLLGGLLWAVYAGAEPWLWERVECRIESSSIVATDDAYRFTVEYHYRYAGASYLSDRVTPWYTGDPDYRDSQALLDAYPPGSSTTCYVNPDEPGESALRAGVEWLLLVVMILPLTFLVGGVAGLRIWWRERTGQPAAPATSGGIWRPLLFFSFFLIPGLLFFVLEFVIPLGQVVSAQGWVEVPCTIVSSRYVYRGLDMESVPDFDLDILYRYRYGKVEYRSNRYDLLGAVSGDTDFLDKVVANHPAGAIQSCYVDPDDPQDAVLYRGFAWELLLFGLFPQPFILFGLWGYYRTLSRTPKSRDRTGHASRSPRDGLWPGIKRTGVKGARYLRSMFFRNRD